MAFAHQFLDELRARAPLAELIGRRVKLIKRGREFVGLCPFHNEKSPSFTVSEDKGFYHCFGCGAHGDVIGFVMQTERASFPEAVERLAEFAGIEVPVLSAAERDTARRQADLIEVVEAACSWFERRLKSTSGQRARNYLKERRLDDATIARFRLGFAPDQRGGLLQALTAEGISEARLSEAGLIGTSESGTQSYERFRNRIIFPITDHRGRVIAFGGRILGQGEPKYLNSPDTPLFHKGHVLYGLATARKAAREKGRVIVAEGYMDVIALARFDFSEAVAPLGTALTESQIGLLWRLAPEPYLCFDGDTAGARAAGRAAERALPMLKPGFSLRFVTLPAGEDPDTLLSRSGAQAIEDALGAARSLSEVIWSMEAQGRLLDTPERRAGLEARLENRAREIADRRVQAHYRTLFRSMLWQAIRGPRARRPGQSPAGARIGAEAWVGGGAGAGWRDIGAHDPARLRRRHEQVLLATVINHTELIAEFGEALGIIEFSDPELDKFRQEILNHFGALQDLDSTGVERHLKDQGFSDVLAGILHPDVYVHAGFARPGSPLKAAHHGLLQAIARCREPDLQAQLSEAERALAENPTEENWARLEQLKTNGQNGSHQDQASMADVDDYVDEYRANWDPADPR